MSIILRKQSSRRKKFIAPVSYLITESPWLESDFLKQINLHIRFFACVFATHRTPENPQQLVSFNKTMYASTSLKIQTHKTITSLTESC